MKLSKNYFEVLSLIAVSKEKLSQRKISKSVNISVGTVNKIINDLIQKEALAYNDGELEVTEHGLELLEPYRAKRAILLAAGFGSRMRPITLNTPKPLVMVHGKRIIESIIEALIDVDITEIYVVRGYLGEQFDALKAKYPCITLIDNPMYNEMNNISSAYVARHLFQNAYVMESDLLINNKAIIKKYQYNSNYTGRYVEVTDDWCFEMKNGYIDKLQVGGKNVYHTYCIAYFTEEDGKQMEKDIEASFSIPGAKDKVWDYVALDYFKDHYKVSVRDVEKSDIDEIDTFNELKAIDKSYDI